MYYPIKCPYCLRAHSNDTVRFRLYDAVEVSSKEARSVVISSMEEDLYDEDFISNENEDWENDGAPEEKAERPAGGERQARISEGKYYTFAELKAFEGQGRITIASSTGEERQVSILNVKGEYKQVNALATLTRDNSDNHYDGDLLTCVSLTIVEGDREKVLDIRDRYCDCDDGRKIHSSSGTVPSYVVLLMGASNSGKTVYLVSLYHELSRKGGYPLPPSENPKESIARISMTALSKGAMDTDIETMEANQFREGKLPPTTVNMHNEPLLLDITVTCNHCDLPKKALLFMRDMPGEFLTNRDRQQEILRIARQFPRFDGFMIMFDPMTFDESVFISADTNTSLEQRKQIERFRGVIVEHISPLMDNNTIQQPTVAIITKGDKFFSAENMRVLSNRNVSYSNPILTAHQRESFDEHYFNELDDGVKRILDVLSNNIDELVSTYFSTAFFTLGAALGKNPPGINEMEKTVDTPNAIKPWRVADPLLRLLMRLNIIPPFDKTRMRETTGETEEERKARKYKNRQALNEWGEKYYSGWKNL